jgi:superfamily II DNA/RNA helicase
LLHECKNIINFIVLIIELKSEDELLSKLRVNLVVETIRSMTIEDDESSDDESAGVRVQQTMVFVNTADAASNLAYEIDKAGVKNAEYHKLVTDGEKQESLRRFREGEVSVLVCTDHAARGLDLPNVRHVVQAEFANNVVQYLHRIGRASRAGVLGKATNIYDRRSEDLVTSILSDTEEKKIDQSFSRRRGFRQKLKKLVRNRAGRVDEIASETSGNASETSENASETASPSPNPIGDEPLDRYFE